MENPKYLTKNNIEAEALLYSYFMTKYGVFYLSKSGDHYVLICVCPNDIGKQAKIAYPESIIVDFDSNNNAIIGDDLVVSCSAEYLMNLMSFS